MSSSCLSLKGLELYKWKETNSGHFERHIDGIELFFHQVNAALPGLAEVGTVRGRIVMEHPFSDIIDRFKTAWKILRYDHPFLAATTLNKKVIYKTPTDIELEEWIEKSIVVCNHADDLVPLLKTNIGAVLFAIQENERVTLIIKCPHRLIDGLGMINLLNSLVKFVVYPRTVSFGTEAKNLTPSLRVAAEISNPAPEKIIQTLNSIREHLSRPPSNRLHPLEASDRLPGPAWKGMTFSPEDTVKIINSAKTNGVTVTHILCAGVALAVQKVGGDHGPWQTLAPFNLRPYLVSPYDNAHKYPVSCWVLQVPIVAELTDLITTAKRIKAAYTSTPKEDVVAEAAAWDLFYEKVAPGQLDLSSMTTPNVSSLGLLDPLFTCANIPGIRVSGLQLGVEMFEEGFVGFHAWTFQGEFQIRASYVNVKYTDHMIQECLQQITSVFEDGLGITLRPRFES